MTYKALCDEKLVEMYQASKDEQAFNELYQRYENFLKNQAEQSAAKTNLDVHSVEHKFVWQFWRAVEKYNPERGASFKTFLWRKLSKAVYDVLMGEKYSKKRDEDGRRILKEQPVKSASMENAAVELNLDDELVVEDICNYLKTKGEIYSTVLKMILNGYTYEEIGDLLGRPGSPAAVRNWGKRLKKKIMQYIQEYYSLV